MSVTSRITDASVPAARARHLRRVHAGPRPTACVTCGRSPNAGPHPRPPAAGLRLRHRSTRTAERTWLPPCDLAALPRATRPSSRHASRRSRAQDGFNWGYDPLHYTAPEGSYATNPQGAARTTEFRVDGPVAQRDRAPRRHGRGLQPHRTPPARPRSRCSTGSCPATTTACSRTARWPTLPAAPTPPPSTP